MVRQDALVTFQCSSPNVVEIVEMIAQGTVHRASAERHPDVIAELEKKYIFFAEEADTARKQIMRGQSCAFSVYFRQL